MRAIFKIIVYYFILCCFSFSVFAASSNSLLPHLKQILVKSTIQEYFELSHATDQGVIEQLSELEIIEKIEHFGKEAEISCLDSKNKQFKEFPANARLISLYLNSILDHLTSYNKNILEEHGIDSSNLCIMYKPIIGTPFVIHSLISTEISLFSVNYKEKNDASVAAVLSHELAHIIKKHFQHNKNFIIKFDKKLKKFLEEGDSIFESLDNEEKNNSDYDFFQSRTCLKLGNTAIDNRTLDSFMKDIKYSSIYKNNKEPTPCWRYWNIYNKKFKPKKAERLKQHEIEADDLGLELFLNAGFDPKIYEQMFLALAKSQFEILTDLSKDEVEGFKQVTDKDYEYFKSLYNPTTCLHLGTKALKNKELPLFMEKIKYIPGYDEDKHPTSCWRYWNVHSKILEKDEDIFKTNDIKNICYLKLNSIQYEFLNDDTWKNSSYPPKDIYDVLNNINDQIDVYDIDMEEPNREDLNFIKEDKTLILNMYDIIDTIVKLDTEFYFEMMSTPF